MTTGVSLIEIDGRIQALTNQRNEANDRIVLLSGMVTERESTIKGLREELAKLKEETKAKGATNGNTDIPQPPASEDAGPSGVSA